MTGGKVPESKKPGVFAEAIAKAKNLTGRFNKAREMSEELADAVIATAETQGTVFAATFAEGYLGEEKMDVGPVDLRLGGGLLLGGYGLYKTMSGKGGSHALALGNGLMAAGIGRIGRHAGRALAEKKNGSATPPAQAPAAAPAPVAASIPQLKGDDIGEIARMVRMVPGTEGDDLAGRRRARARRRNRDEDEEVSGRGRFIRERR
jgi:hypothetical protein